MTASDLTQFLVDVTRGHRKADFARDPESVIVSAGLSEELAAAIRAQDLGALRLAGAHPMALLYFSRICGWDSERYYRCMAEATRGAQGGAVQEAAIEQRQTHR